MALFKTSSCEIKGISATVPKEFLDNKELELLGSEDERKKFIDTVGIEYRHIVSENICTSDLCLDAAEKLIEKLKWDKSDIGCLVFVTQTPDYQLPSTACILQDRLGLPKDTYAIQVSLGCSGWVYGLSVISSLFSTGGFKKGILLAGDTVTKTKSDRDKATFPLFGDAGTATALEYSEKGAGNMFFESGTDGGNHQAIIIEDGGYRNPVSEESFKVKEQSDGSIRNKLQSYLNGQDVFIFGITRAPKSIKSVLDFSNNDVEDLDFVLLHQANKFMLDKITKKLKIDKSKVPLSLRKYGNTSSASIPLTLVSELKDQLESGNKLRIAACGFGVGLSWSTAILELKDIVVPEVAFI